MKKIGINKDSQATFLPTNFTKCFKRDHKVTPKIPTVHKTVKRR